MRSIVFSTLFTGAIALAAPALAGAGGMIHQTASTTVEETVDAFVELLKSKGATVFAEIDHSAGALSVDMEIPASTLVVFGNPRIGTPLMEAAPTMGADLPLRVLFYEEEGKTHIVYHDLDPVAKLHGIPADHPALIKAKGALRNLTGAVAK
jgi:uncharacterized protein (DUF302 family)